MAEGHCRLNRELVREVLLDGSDFLKVLQRVPQTEMTEHVGPRHMSVIRTARGNVTVTSPGR